jgi:DNA primase
VYCEYHSNHRTASAEVDKESGLFYCFSCNTTTDLIHLIMKASGCTFFEAVRTIGDVDYNIRELIEKKTSEEIEAFDPLVIEQLHNNVWGRGSEYLNSRNITDESIHTFMLGYSYKQDMVIVPVHSNVGVLVGFVGRSVEGKVFKNNTGFKKSRVLFNLNRTWLEPRIFVVESSFDAIRLSQVGIPAVATLGAGISPVQIDLLHRSFDDVIVIPDNDTAGKNMAEKIISKIPGAQSLQIEGHDVGSLSDADLSELV